MTRHRMWSRAALATLVLAGLACNAPLPAIPFLTPATATPVPTAVTAGEQALHLDGGPVIGSPRETRVAISEQVPVLEDLAPEEYDSSALSVVGETYTYTVELDATQPLIWVYGWCTTTQDILQQNLEHMSLAFLVNQAPVAIGQFHTFEGQPQSDGLACQWFTAVVYDWPSGTTELETKVTYEQQINDGISDYAPGTQSFVYTVTLP